MKSFLKTIISIININKISYDWKKNVFFSENENYTAYFYPLVKKFLDNKKKVIYVTSQIDDPILKLENEYLKIFYVSPLIGQILFFNYLKCERIFLTMPDVGNYHLKKSNNCKVYTYIFHAPTSLNMLYKHRALFNYDEFFFVGEHQYKEFSEYIEKYNLKNKKLFKIGYFRLDEISKNKTENRQNPIKKIIIAPTFGKFNLINLCGAKIIEHLIQHKFEVILRPHIQSLTSTLSASKYDNIEIKKIEKKFKKFDNFKIQKTNFSNTDGLSESDYLITDWSGVGIEYAFAYERPVIYIDTPRKILNVKFNDIPSEPLEVTIRDKIGIVVAIQEVDQILDKIGDLSKNYDNYVTKIKKLRKEIIYNYQHSADYAFSQLNDKL